ncbi:sugar transferase [Fusobacterium sp. SYSU M8D902]|uniref:sugar transferase n=1 Tax=Fusobacterium sp. SYSU M8D902 TaxID=3159562 RepID=UPI0032E43DCD
MFLKRSIDIVVSFIGIILFLPVMLIISIAIKLTSKGSILFKQRRVTIDMKEFTIYKFRSMKIDFDKDAKGIQVRGNSNVITSVGRIIRKTKLDELPQLFNILLGDMSFIGPRPELPRRLCYYSERDKKIFSVRSGITSPASIIFSNEEYLMNQVKDPEKFYIEQIMPYKIELNLYYIERKNIFYDIYLIFVTFFKIIKKIEDKDIIKDKDLLSKKKEIEEKIGIEY